MVAEISVTELQSVLDDDAPVRIVDIRSPTAFRRGHIPGSENIPFPQLTTGVADLAGADHVVTVCPHGHDSVRAANIILSYEGIDDARVESLAGGLTAWDGQVETGESGRSSDEAGDDTAPF